MQATSKEQSIRIASSGGLSEDQIQNMVREAEANAEKDKSVSLILCLSYAAAVGQPAAECLLCCVAVLVYQVSNVVVCILRCKERQSVTVHDATVSYIRRPDCKLCKTQYHQIQL